MNFKTQNIEEYLKPTEYIESQHPTIINLAETLTNDLTTDIEITKILYEYVRDEIPHSADIEGKHVTLIASDVLKYKEGICYAKSVLLAALLRSRGIPSGLCYQKLILDDNTASYLIIHGLNALYLQSLDKWIRLDARGNKPGVFAEFSINEEKLAFPVRNKLGERDIPVIYADVPESIIAVVHQGDTPQYLYKHLATEI